MGRFDGLYSLQDIGSGRFKYTPDPNNPFHYIRNNRKGQQIERIQPGEMETDGGSIPKFAQIFKGLSPWEYGPAYLIHDWEFGIGPNGTKSFEASNLTLAEGIWTLMNRGYLNDKPEINKENVRTVYWAVSGLGGRLAWKI